MTTLEEYADAREMVDILAEVRLCWRSGRIREAEQWINTAYWKAHRELLAWEKEHGVTNAQRTYVPRRLVNDS